jgi:hypothetical protein
MGMFAECSRGPGSYQGPGFFLLSCASDKHRHGRKDVQGKAFGAGGDAGGGYVVDKRGAGVGTRRGVMVEPP